MAKEASLDDCLRLLKGDSDEQRLVGLLLATKFVKGDDIDAVRKLFDAIGFQFINRLIKTGAGQVGKENRQRQSYLHLALSILAAFCRVPELASSDDTVAKVPVLVTTLASKQDQAAAGDCHECLLSIAVSSEKGIQALLESRALPAVAYQLHDADSDAPWIPAALKLFHVLLVKVAAENRSLEHAKDLAYVIPQVAKQLAMRQDIVKFEALSLLCSLLVSDISPPIRAALGNVTDQSDWPAHVRTGVGQILQSHVAVEQKQIVLELAESIVGLVGGTWLVGPMGLPTGQEYAPSDRFFLIMVETLRVETAVLLNEVARLAFDYIQATEAGSSKAAEATVVTQRRLMKCFSLLEVVISVMSTQEGKASVAEGGKHLDEMTLEKTIIALNEVVGTVLELLEDAEANHRSRGDVLVASVRLVSRYLAEAPAAHQKRCLKLLHFLFSISAESDDRPFLALQFMLPFLTQLTLDCDGCMALLACGGHIQIIMFMSWALQRKTEIEGALVDICDILLNLLTKKDRLRDGVNVGEFLTALPALATWVGQGVTKMESAMAASVCISVLALTNEDFLRTSSEFGPGQLDNVFQVIILNLEQCFKGGDDIVDEEDLLELVLSGSVECLYRYPSFKQKIRFWWQHSMVHRHSSVMQDGSTSPSLQQLLAMALFD